MENRNTEFCTRKYQWAKICETLVGGKVVVPEGVESEKRLRLATEFSQAHRQAAYRLSRVEPRTEGTDLNGTETQATRVSSK